MLLWLTNENVLVKHMKEKRRRSQWLLFCDVLSIVYKGFLGQCSGLEQQGIESWMLHFPQNGATIPRSKNVKHVNEIST